MTAGPYRHSYTPPHDQPCKVCASMGRFCWGVVILIAATIFWWLW